MRRLQIFIATILMSALISGSSYAYVDIEKATFWHFLFSRWGQIYAPKLTYRLGEKYLRSGGEAVGKYLKTEEGAKFLARYSPELGAHFGWRLGCNLGWEVAGAILMIGDHRSVNLVTMIQDSAFTPGLLLYPFGQVIGQHIVGDLSLNLLNKYTRPRVMSSLATSILVDDKGIPVLWENATVQRMASRFIGLAVGTYLAWSLFDLGHNLLYSKQPLLDAFAWDKYKILAMTGFTFGGYVGHNAGFTLSNKKILPDFYETRLYKNLAARAEKYVVDTDPVMAKIARLSPKRLLYRISKGILNRDALLWNTGSPLLASPVNALFCTVLAIGLPWAVNKFEGWLIQHEVTDLEKPEDYAAKFKEIPTAEEKQKFADDLLAEVDSGLKFSFESLKSSLTPDPSDDGADLTDEQKTAAKEIGDELAKAKPLLFETMMIIGMNSNALVDIAHKKIGDIDSRESLITFLSDELLPAMGFDSYGSALRAEVDKSIPKDITSELPDLKKSLHLFADEVIPSIYAGKISESIELFSKETPKVGTNG